MYLFVYLCVSFVGFHTAVCITNYFCVHPRGGVILQVFTVVKRMAHFYYAVVFLTHSVLSEAKLVCAKKLKQVFRLVRNCYFLHILRTKGPFIHT
jgi:hypothetical protein